MNEYELGNMGTVSKKYLSQPTPSIELNFVTVVCPGWKVVAKKVKFKVIVLNLALFSHVEK
jgi:hypothetical protein